jgi:hypothetical protein
MNITIKSSNEYLIKSTKIDKDIKEFILYGCHQDSFFIVMLQHETTAFYMFTDIELLISFIVHNKSFKNSLIQSFDDTKEAFEYLYALTI